MPNLGYSAKPATAKISRTRRQQQRQQPSHHGDRQQQQSSGSGELQPRPTQAGDSDNRARRSSRQL